MYAVLCFQETSPATAFQAGPMLNAGLTPIKNASQLVAARILGQILGQGQTPTQDRLLTPTLSTKRRVPRPRPTHRQATGVQETNEKLYTRADCCQRCMSADDMPY